MKALRDKLPEGSQIHEESFDMGALALKQELEQFIFQNLKGERIGDFDKGQDDGLQWVLDHLSFIFDDYRIP